MVGVWAQRTEVCADLIDELGQRAFLTLEQESPSGHIIVLNKTMSLPSSSTVTVSAASFLVSINFYFVFSI
jgi:hypothetical protein